MMQFGMPTLIENHTLEENAALCEALGLRFIELNMNFPEYQVDRLEQTDELVRIAEQHHLYYTVHLDENLNIADFNPLVTQAYLETVRRTILAAKALLPLRDRYGDPAQPLTLNMHMHHGIYITLPDRKVQMYERNFETYMHPASTLKVLTGLAAILYLGHNYTYKTTLGVSAGLLKDNGQLILDKAGVLHGNIFIKFVGDPSFTSKNYSELLSNLSKLGVRRIAGDIIIDVSNFAGLSKGEGWSWSDLPICFSAPAGAVIIDRNCVFAQLQPHGINQIATPVLSAQSPITIHSDAVGVNPQNYGANCELEADLYMRNQYQITGCVPVQPKNQPWPLSLSVSDPNQWAVDWTNILLNRHKIDFESIKIAKQPQENYQVLAQSESKPLSELVKYMLYRSNNLYADAIAKTVAFEFYKKPATYDRTAMAIRTVLKNYAQINLGNSYIVDGNGLSPHNIVTPKKMLEVLQFINVNNDSLHFIELLPVSGESGTMRYRASTSNPPLAKRVIAKTGTLQNVSNLMGFITTKTGSRVPFVFYTNAITYDQKTRDLVKFKRIASPHLKYERYVLENIYNELVIGRDF